MEEGRATAGAAKNEGSAWDKGKGSTKGLGAGPKGTYAGAGGRGAVGIRVVDTGITLATVWGGGRGWDGKTNRKGSRPFQEARQEGAGLSHFLSVSIPHCSSVLLHQPLSLQDHHLHAVGAALLFQELPEEGVRAKLPCF